MQKCLAITTRASARAVGGLSGGAVTLGTEDAWTVLNSCKVFLASSGEEVGATG